jgi:molybdenum cofactor cytidylyltransferase
MSPAAIILAAGRGTRFGAEPKLLAHFEGKPLVRHVAEAAVSSPAAPVLVVTGHRADEVEAALAGLPVTFVRNPAFADGLSSSLKAGFAALPAAAEAAFILLGDMPRITPALVTFLSAAWVDAGRPSALVPACSGQRGNPVVLSTALRGEIVLLTGDAGAGALLRQREDVVTVETGDPAILADVDTPAALDEVRR